MGLIVTHSRDWFGMPVHLVRSDGECCGQPATLAHVGFELVAMTLAEPLRRALHEHYAAHHCPGGIWHCETGKALWDLLPAGDQIVIA